MCESLQHPLTSMLHTQLLWYRAECSFPTFLTSLTSHTYTLWSLYTQARCRAAGSKVRANVSGCWAPTPAGSGLPAGETAVRVVASGGCSVCSNGTRGADSGPGRLPGCAAGAAW